MSPSPLDRTILAAPALIVTLAQVRYDNRPSIATPATGEAMAKRLRALGLTTMTQIQQKQVLVALNGAPKQPIQDVGESVGWQFAAKDSLMVLTVLTDQMTLETRSYQGWDVFASDWAQCVATLVDAADPGINLRLGLRYVNRLTPAGVAQPSDLGAQGLVEVAFLGPAVASGLSEFATAVDGRVTLTFPDDTDALVQYGAVKDGDLVVFAVDIDCFQTHGESFDAKQISKASQTLNDRSLQIFQTVVCQPLRDQMNESGVLT